MKKLISRQEAAEKLNCSLQTVTNWVNSGVLKGHMKNGRLFIDSDTLTQHFDTLEDVAQTEERIEALKAEIDAKEKELNLLLHDRLEALGLWSRSTVSNLSRSAVFSFLNYHKSLLPPRHLEILKHVIEYGDIKSVAEEQGVSSTRIVQIAEKAIRILSRALPYDELCSNVATLREENTKLEQKLSELIKEYNIEEKSDLKFDVLSIPVNELDLSCRATNCLRANDIDTLGGIIEMFKHDKRDFLKFRNLGRKTLFELEDLLERLAIQYNFDELGIRWKRI